MSAIAHARPTAVRVIDLERPLDAPAAAPGDPYRAALLLVRWHGTPLGTVTIELDGDDQGFAPDRLAGAIRSQLGPELQTAGLKLPDVFPATGVGTVEEPARVRALEPTLTVVVTTCRRPETLGRCLESILASDYGRFDVVVVENRPGSPATARLLAERFATADNIHYAEEPRPGSSHARNTGLRRAAGEIVAFVDDDVVVDPGWMRAAVAGFDRAPDIGCVTGMILPLRLDTPAQVLLEQFATFGKGFHSVRFSLLETRSTDVLFPYTAGRIGSGANTIVRAGLVRDLGGFDPRLGPGTPTKGGEELDLYIRLLRSGAAIAYEPTALVWHEHPDRWEQLRRHAFHYGVGLGAMLTKQFVTGPERWRFLTLVPAGVRYAFDPRSRKNKSKTAGFPSRLDALERTGMLAGPAAFALSAAATKVSRAWR
jgi:O-antigen biosynthesis protein